MPAPIQQGFKSYDTVAGQQKPPTIWNITPEGSLELKFHPGQSKVWTCDKRFLLMLAGTQGGKHHSARGGSGARYRDAGLLTISQ